MRYLGGKVRIAKPLTEFLRSQRKPGQLYVEPFIGGGAVFQLMDNPRIGSDIAEDLILFYKAIKKGWIPPTHVSEDEYREQKTAKPSALRGFVGYFCSFGGKWFGGYARGASTRNYALNGHNQSLVLAQRIKLARFNCLDYEDLLNRIPNSSLVYCDPPYSTTTKYQLDFDTNTFWEVMKKFSRYHKIFISEYTAPSNFQCVWEVTTKTDLHTKTGKAIRIEKLWTLKR